MSPTLFNYAIDFVLERALRDSLGVQVGENHYLTDLTYADDIASLRQRCSLRALPSVLLQRRLRWFGHASRRAPGEIIRDVICPTPLQTWRKRRGGGN